MKRSAVVIAAVVIVALAIGGALYVQSMPTTRQITLQSFDFFFTMPGSNAQNPTVTVRSGDTLILTIQNLGTKNDHEFFVLTQSDYVSYITALVNGQNASEPKPAFPNASVEDVPAGQSKTGTFVVGQSGTYVYACLDKEGTAPLTHAHKGMFGTFQVQAGGLFSITKSFGSMFGNVFNAGLTSVPTIVIWQAVILLSLAAVTRKSA